MTQTTVDPAVDQGTFTVRRLPWMQLGTVLDEPLTPSDAIKRAKLDWTVEKRPTYVELSDGKLRQIDDRFAVVRSSDEAVLGSVGAHYEPYQNHEAFEFLLDLVDDPDDAIIEAAGSVRGGRWVFMVVRFPGLLEDLPNDDEHELYAIVRAGHDGLKAVEVLLMPLRGLCMNMLGLASFGRKAPQRWSLPHTRTLRERLAEARHTLEGAEAYAEEFQRVAKQLAAAELEEEALREVLERALPAKPMTATHIDAVVAGFHTSPTIPEPLRGTAWAGLNALTEHLDWGRERLTDEGRFHSALDLHSARVRNRAAALLLAR